MHATAGEALDVLHLVIWSGRLGPDHPRPVRAEAVLRAGDRSWRRFPYYAGRFGELPDPARFPSPWIDAVHATLDAVRLELADTRPPAPVAVPHVRA